MCDIVVWTASEEEEMSNYRALNLKELEDAGAA